ncbi:unnamed protein product, partial [Polarella glacialis]
MSEGVLDDFSTLAWILKDFCWVLQFPFLGWPAFLLSFGSEIVQLTKHWQTYCGAQRCRHLAVILWLAGSVVWMTAEFLFDEPRQGSIFPWHTQPAMGHGHEQEYDTSTTIARNMFVAAFCVFAAGYSFGRSTDVRKQAALDLEVWLGAWLLKEISWTMDLKACGMASFTLAALLLMRSFSKTGDRRHLAELLWLVGNTMWFVDEVYLDDAYPRRRVQASCAILMG